MTKLIVGLVGGFILAAAAWFLFEALLFAYYIIFGG